MSIKGRCFLFLLFVKSQGRDSKIIGPLRYLNIMKMAFLIFEKAIKKHAGIFLACRNMDIDW